MKLSKEQKAELAAQLSLPWGNVELVCDGYRVALQVQRMKGGMTYRVMTYINGFFEHKWVSGTKEYPEQKLLRKSVRPVCSSTEKAKAEKSLGKRFVAKSTYYSATITLYLPDWASGKAAINHLCKVCESVQIAPAKDLVQ